MTADLRKVNELKIIKFEILFIVCDYNSVNVRLIRYASINEHPKLELSKCVS